jgi:hypothetical protein
MPWCALLSTKYRLTDVPGSSDIARLRKPLLALSFLYGTECKSAYKELGDSMAVAAAAREQMIQYYRMRQGPEPFAEAAVGTCVAA